MCNELLFRGSRLLTCGNKLVSCVNNLLTCGNNLASNGNELLTCGKELLTRGRDFLSHGNKMKNATITVLCPFLGSVFVSNYNVSIIIYNSTYNFVSIHSVFQNF